jgi:nitrite reductase/ring-hydroxylating ferredoxin subunit
MSGIRSEQGTFWAIVLAAESLPAGRLTSIEHGDRRLVIYNLDGRYYATEDIKVQDLVYVSDGWIEGQTVMCPARRGAFDIRSGRWQGAPSTPSLATFPVRIVGDDVQVQFNDRV